MQKFSIGSSAATFSDFSRDLSIMQKFSISSNARHPCLCAGHLIYSLWIAAA